MTDVIDDDLSFPPGAFLVLFEDDEPRLQVHGRPATPRDGVDAAAEMAVLIAASGLTQVAFFVPSRMRDLREGGVVATPIVVTRAERLDDGRIDLEVMTLPEDGTASMALDPAVSPVSSLLCEALSSEIDVPLADVAAVLEGWGHAVLARPELPPPDHAGLSQSRYRVHRLAEEWSRRHRPMARAGEDRRPAAPANLPVGFRPACPL